MLTNLPNNVTVVGGVDGIPAQSTSVPFRPHYVHVRARQALTFAQGESSSVHGRDAETPPVTVTPLSQKAGVMREILAYITERKRWTVGILMLVFAAVGTVFRKRR